MACVGEWRCAVGGGSLQGRPSPTAAPAAVTSPGRSLRSLGEVSNAAVARPPLPGPQSRLPGESGDPWGRLRVRRETTQPTTKTGRSSLAVALS